MWSRVSSASVLTVITALLIAGCSDDSPGPGSSPTPSASVSLTPSPTPSATPSPTPSPAPSRTPSATPSPTPSPTAPPSATPRPSAPATATVLWKVPTNRKVVALTFDAGSDVGDAAAILDFLRAQRIKAGFGVTGKWAREHPALVQRMADEGHLLVNHTDRHLSFTGFSTRTDPLTRSERLAALAGAEAAIRAAAGVSTKPWFRPPYGDRDGSVDRDVAAAGYRFELMWTVDTLGWKGVPPAQVVQRVLDRLTPGELVLMHVGAASTDDEALPDLVRQLRARGYGFVRADGR